MGLPWRGGEELGVERALCPILIDREEPLTGLEDALLAAHRGDGQVALLAAEAGMGKTRLAAELQRRAERAGTLVLRGSCSEADLTLPYLPFVEAIGNYLLGANLDEIRGGLGGAASELARLFPYLGPAPAGPGGDPGQARLRLYESLWTLHRTVAAGRGLLLTIEDAHWADASTLELLDYLARRLRLAPILLLVTYRSDEVNHRHPLLALINGWRRAGLAQVIALPPLGPDEVAAMVTAICDDQPVGLEFRDFLHLRKEGNPFVVEEFLRTALESGDIFKSSGGWKRRASASLRLPRTIGDAVLIRVERMTDDEARIVRIACVLGVTFAYRVLLPVSDRPEDVVQASLRTLVRLQLIEEEADGEGRYHFRHALTRDVIYDSLLGPERNRLHERAAEALRALPRVTPAELASHLLAAGLDVEALPVCLKAAEDAERQYAYRQAADLYERVLPHITHPALRASLVCRLGNALYLAGDRRRAAPFLEEGIRLLEETGQAVEAAANHLVLGRCLWEGAEPGLARRHYERARQILEPLGASEDLAFAYIRLAGLHAFAFEPAKTLALAERAVAIAQAAGSQTARIWAYIYVGLGLSDTGHVDEALRHLDRSYREALEQGMEWLAGSALATGINMRLQHLRGREAVPLLDQLRQLQGWHLREILASFYEGLIRLALGQPDLARRCTQAGIALATDTQATTFEGWMQCTLAMVAAVQGRVEEAQRLLAAIPPRREHQEAILRGYAALRVHLGSGDAEAAAAEAHLLLELLDRSRPPVAQELQALDSAVEGLLATDQVEIAAATLRQMQASINEANPYVARMESRLALAQGDLDRAETRIHAAVASFAQAGYHTEEWRSRRVLAAIWAERGQVAGAVEELRSVLEASLEAGAVSEVTEAARELRRLGVPVPEEPEAVRLPLEPELTRPGERFVTIVSIDVRRYTGLTEERPPGEMADRLATLYRWSRREIERQHGLVHAYAGDAVMATFNLSVMRLEHAVDACQAALAVRDRADYVGLRAGIGIATGSAVVGELAAGTPLTAIGETANLAARLQARAEPGEILLSQEAFRRAALWLEERGLVATQESLLLKGIASPAVVYRLSAPLRTVPVS